MAPLMAGALWTIRDVSNPDHVRQACTSMRALFELMPQSYANAPIRENPAEGGNKLRDILDAYENVTKKSPELVKLLASALGQFDEHILSLFAKLSTALTWRQKKVSVSQRTKGLNDHLSKHGIALNEADAKAFEKAWQDQYQYFSDVYHAKKSPTTAEAARRIDDCVTLLHRRMSVTPSKAADELDKLIAEAEGVDAE